MATSEHDRLVLREFEKEFVSDARSSSSVERRAAGLLLAFGGIVVGLLVLFVGLSLADGIGTCVGVGGTVLLVASAWLGVHNLSPRPRSGTTSGQDDSTL